jgi:ABC-2 type transport system permease protein
MNTMKWLLRREFWEYKGAMFWAPIVVAALLFALQSTTILYGVSQNTFHGEISVKLSEEGHSTDIGTAFASLPPAKKQQLTNFAASGYIAFAAPLFLMLAVMSFFYCLNALSEERRDRSILFWKSLPVSDTQTVASKVLTAGVVAPLITIAVGLCLSLLTLLVIGIAAAFQGVNLFGAVLSNANFYITPLQVVGLLPVYLVWALPTIGWLLMVSAWAKSKVFLWAVGAPLLLLAIVRWVSYTLGVGLNLDWFAQNVVSRGLLGLVPGNWLPLANVDKSMLVGSGNSLVLSDLFTASWMTLLTPQALIGAVAGAAMIFAAMRLRRWKDEG